VILWLALAHDRPAFGPLWAALVAAWFWYGPIWRIPHGGHVELHDTFAQLLVGNSYTIAMLLFVGGMIVMLALRHSRGRDARRRAQVLTGTPLGLSEAPSPSTNPLRPGFDREQRLPDALLTNEPPRQEL
jgi:hypothetical protein